MEPRADDILGDITVLDLSQGISGPYCAKLLAGLGARVIKVEPTGGDEARRMGPFFHDDPDPEKSGTFLYLNTSKESITINLNTAGGASLLKRLVAQADVVVESFAPGVMAGWGLSYDDLALVKPNLIHCAVTDFGQTGPYKDYKGGELVVEATGALLYVMGEEGREPLKLGASTALMTGGISSFSAIMVALYQRDETGEGQFIDVSLQETIVVGGIHATIHSQYGEHDPGRRPNTLSKAKDGWVNVGIQQATWRPFCEMIGRPELVDDPRFMDQLSRRDNAAAFNEVINEWLSTQTKEGVYHKMQAIRSIAGYVADMSDLVKSEQYKSRGFFRTVDHPSTGPLPYPGPVFTVGDLPWRQERAPLLGEHNESILHGELGISKEELARLRAQGVI